MKNEDMGSTGHHKPSQPDSIPVIRVGVVVSHARFDGWSEPRATTVTSQPVTIHEVRPGKTVNQVAIVTVGKGVTYYAVPYDGISWVRPHVVQRVVGKRSWPFAT